MVNDVPLVDNQQPSGGLMKICSRCKEEKPRDEYAPNSKTGKLQSCYCRQCRREYEREHRAANPEAHREKSKRHRQNNWDSAKAAQYKWRTENPEKWQENQKRWREKHQNEYMAEKRSKNKDLVFSHYGKVCACCGETELMFLSIDHVNNDGAEHRRSLKGQIGNGGSSFFDWLVRSGFPEGFQTLCRNCNWGKHVNGGVCPHQPAEGSTTIPKGSTAKRPEARGTHEDDGL